MTQMPPSASLSDRLSDVPIVHLIRHGKPSATWGEAGADPDPGLDDEGRAQAEAAAAALWALPVPLRPSRVVSSSLRRCRETAQPLAALLGVDLVIEPGVAEIPTPAGLSAAERPAWLRHAFSGAWADIPGDRDYAVWAAAVAAACARYPGAAVYSHFVAINAAVGAARGDPRVRQFEPGHTSVTTFSISDGRLRLEQLGAATATQVL